jgi:hypothetical protein
MAKVASSGSSNINVAGQPDAVAVTAVDRFGNVSAPTVLAR